MAWICQCGTSNEGRFCRQCGCQFVHTPAQHEKRKLNKWLRRIWIWMNTGPPLPPPIICKVCDRGELRRKQLYRMSGMVVFVGYLLLVPSVVGILWSIALFFNFVGDEATDVAVLGGGLSIATAIASVVGGLVGWLLVMKKRVLQCSVCGAVINAS